ncbi:MAG: TldD/PmbA family protein [Clostridia bacterium]|nr:TldD/PmbA family protein [Clostridia bacterium]
MNVFITKLFAEAKKAGLEASEAYLLEKESFEAMAVEGEINHYSANNTRGLGFRAMLHGKMGYAYTEAFDKDAVDQLVKGALESARLCEEDDGSYLYDGKTADPAIQLFDSALQDVSPKQKLDYVLKLEKAAKDYDRRIDKVGDCSVFTGMETVRIVNTHGLDKTYTQNFCGAALQPVANEGDCVSAGFDVVVGRDFTQLQAACLGSRAAKIAVEHLHGTSVPSGSYRVIFENAAMSDLLGVFSEAFSAENAQQGLSLLKGKLGEIIAAKCVTLYDDPLLPGGMGSRPFDAEGVPSGKHTVIENGRFHTFLHNLKTAHKDSVPTTGNASKAGYAATVRVSPSNFYFQPGSTDLDGLIHAAGSGVLITELAGTHSGANAVSGDFSLYAKGFFFENGARARPVDQITVAGNFFDMLKSIRAVGSDLRFPRGGMGSPSVDAGELTIGGN